MSKLLEAVKEKLDAKLAEKPVEEPEEIEDDMPEVWTPFAKKIYTDIKLYKAKIGDSAPTRAVATKFRDDINDKLEKGKEKKNMVDYYNTQFKLPGVSTHAWNYFAETVIDPQEKETSEKKLEDGIIDIMFKYIDHYENRHVYEVATKLILKFIKEFNKKESII